MEDYSALIIDIRAWPCTNAASGLSELHLKPQNSNQIWRQRNPEKEEREGSKSLLSRFLFLFSQTQEHLPRDINDNSTILIKRLSSLT